MYGVKTRRCPSINNHHQTLQYLRKHVLDHGDGKRCGLAAARLCAAEDVAAPKTHRDALGLDGGGPLVAVRPDVAQHARVQVLWEACMTDMRRDDTTYHVVKRFYWCHVVAGAGVLWRRCCRGVILHGDVEALPGVVNLLGRHGLDAFARLPLGKAGCDGGAVHGGEVVAARVAAAKAVAAAGAGHPVR